jgi:hypothetical protein
MSHTHKHLLLLFTFTLFVLATPSRALAGDEYIGTWLNKVFSAVGVSFFDPTPLTNPPLHENNLKPASFENVKRFLNYSYAAYCFTSLEAWTCDACQALGPNVRLISILTNTTYGTRAFVAVDDSREEIVLTFRGASNFPNLIQDIFLLLLPLSPTDISGIRIHAGFYASTQSLYQQVLGALTSLITTYPTYKVVVNGHSLGGSQATITIFLFKRNGAFPNTTFELYTYGEPREGNLAFATYFNRLNITVARVTNRADYAVHIPTPAALGFVHHANEVWIKDGITRNCSNEKYEDPACSNSQGPIYPSTSRLDHISYFGADWTVCWAEDPTSFIFQALIPLQPNILKLKRLWNKLLLPLSASLAKLRMAKLENTFANLNFG